MQLIIVAFALGMPLEEIINSIETGLGSTLGHIGLILGFGAVIGRLIADAGNLNLLKIIVIFLYNKYVYKWYNEKIIEISDNVSFYGAFR